MTEKINSKFDKLIEAIGPEWKNLDEEKYDVKPISPENKYRDRIRNLQLKFVLMQNYLQEYVNNSGKNVIDISCGNGAFLEIFRYYGHNVFGIDIQYDAFLKSQKVSYIMHDCSKIPYPVKDKSYDLLISTGAITFIPLTNGMTWNDIMNEFSRIAKTTIFVTVNKGKNLTKYCHFLDEWNVPGWKLDSHKGFFYKWRCIEGNN